MMAAGACLFATAAFAQSTMPAQNTPSNPAMHTDSNNTSAMPVAGANSFTMGEAKSRIEAKGYTKVSHLKKDSKGVWRGKAMKDGSSVDVSLDFEGNVNAM
jgi:hypothetical protein